jgi:hypothetical protein
MKGKSWNGFGALLILFGLFLLAGCAPEKTGNDSGVRKKYSIYVMMKDGAEYLLQTDTIDSGHIDPVAQGAKVVPARIFYDLIVNQNQYYRLDWKTGKFLRNVVENKTYKQTGSVQLAGTWAVDNYSWLGDTLLLIGHDSKNSKVRYAKITLDPMKAIEGTIDIPAPVGGFNSHDHRLFHVFEGRSVPGLHVPQDRT